MCKPIRLTDELLQQLRNTKMFDGRIIQEFKWKDGQRASVTFSAAAFAKMTMLVQTFTSEVAWHGIAYRDENDPSRFYIEDILVYPQTVTGSTVTSDQEKYQTWLYAHDDDVFNNIRMHGHSHVNMATTPSSIDNQFQSDILTQLDDDMFYIFMIWNKKFERTVKVYDMKYNVLYEKDDVDVYIGGEGVDLNAFINNAKSLVVESVRTYGNGYQYNQYGQRNTPATPTSAVAKAPATTTPAATGSVASEVKTKPKTSVGDKSTIGSSGRNYCYGHGFEEDDNCYN